MDIGGIDSWRKWFWRGKLLWASVLLAVLGIAWWACRSHDQDTVRQLGLIYEVIGVLAVIVEIAKVAANNSIAPIPVRIVKYWRNIPLLTRNRNIVLSGVAGVSGLGSVRARGSLGLPPGPTMEQRVDRLERLVSTLEDRIETVDLRVETEEKVRATAISTEVATREKRSAELLEMIKEVETGGLDLSLFGVVWLLIGTLLSTGTVELCRWVLHCV